MPITRLQRTGSSFLPFTSTPSRDMEEVENRLSSFLRDPLSTFFTPGFTTSIMPKTFVGWVPPVEISETEKEYTLKAELPGMMKKDLNIDYEKGILTISGEKFEEKKEGDNRQYHLIERSFGTFDRSFTFPEIVDSEKITAEFNDGMLFIHLPKNEEARKPRGRKIEIAEKLTA